MLTGAWLTARLYHSDPKKFPSLDKITGKRKAPVEQTPEQLLGAVKALKKMFGG
jgi:hypothetical protein